MGFVSDTRTSRGVVVGFMAVGLFWGSFAALVPEIKPQAGLSDGGFGMVMLVASIGAVMAMWLAPLADKLMGRASVALLMGAMAVAFLIPGLANSWATLTFGMVLAAMTSGTLDVSVNARVSALEASSGRPLMNLNHGLFSVAYTFAALFVGYARETGWTPFEIFVAMAAVTLVLMVQALAAPVSTGADAPDAQAPVRLRWALILPGGLIILLAFLAEQATEGWSALHLERGLGAGAAQGAFGPALLGITMAVGRLSGQVIAQRFSEAQIITVASLLCTTGAMIAAAAPGIGIAYLGFAVLGLGVSVIGPMGFAWVGRLVSPSQRALAISRVTVIGYFGFFIGPPTMGFLAEGFGLATSFAAIGALVLLIPAVLIPAMRRLHT